MGIILYVCIYLFLYFISIYIYLHTHTHIHTDIHIYIHTYTHTYTYTYLLMHTYTHSFICRCYICFCMNHDLRVYSLCFWLLCRLRAIEVWRRVGLYVCMQLLYFTFFIYVSVWRKVPFWSSYVCICLFIYVCALLSTYWGYVCPFWPHICVLLVKA